MKPLIQNQFEVLALLEGRKTRFSILMKPQPIDCFHIHQQADEMCEWRDKPMDLMPDRTNPNEWYCRLCGNGVMPSGKSMYKSPYSIGELIYVREAWRLLKAGYIALNRGFGHSSMPSQYEYKANSEKTGPWKSPVTMPKSAARIFLKVVDVKRMRVQDMTEDEAVHEGIERFKDKSGFKIGYKNYYKEGEAEKTVAYGSPRKSFQSLHIKKHGLDSWNNNAWIFSFEVERVTI
jgi:hypothetical protein